ncbi:MAG: AraC family transcriptional regulator [Cyclobacteriaceae bacterium]|nr:AraC family transcriptional regulator [Cyclobacteriaceae bacterium]
MAYKIDLFSIFIFLGIVQASFLCLFFFSFKSRNFNSNFFQGIMIFSMAACSFEILLCYTGAIINVLWLVDFSEALAFIIGPAFYFMAFCLIHGKAPKRWYWHWGPALIWLILQIPFLIQGNDVKYNAWIGSYHPPGLSFIDDTPEFFSPPYHSEFILGHLAIYLVMGLIIAIQAFKKKQQSVLTVEVPALKKIRSSLIQVGMVAAMIFIVKLFNRDDMGDHLFAAYTTIPIYLISFQVIRQSGFFKQTTITETTKYKSSSLSAEDQALILDKLKTLMSEKKLFLQPNFTLPDLAVQLNVSVHQVSQAINDGLGKSFFEMLAEHRIEEAKVLLITKANIKVEEIAEEVGYNSKSSFNTAFKKLVGMTPSEWRTNAEKQKRG